MNSIIPSTCYQLTVPGIPRGERMNFTDYLQRGVFRWNQTRIMESGRSPLPLFLPTSPHAHSNPNMGPQRCSGPKGLILKSIVIKHERNIPNVDLGPVSTLGMPLETQRAVKCRTSRNASRIYRSQNCENDQDYNRSSSMSRRG